MVKPAEVCTAAQAWAQRRRATGSEPSAVTARSTHARVSSAVFDPVLANNSANLTQSLLSERYAGGGIGCNAAPTRAPVSPVGWLLALCGALTLTFRRRRSS